MATISFIASYAYYAPRRCGQECAVPGQGETYQGLLGELERAHLASWCSSGPDPASGQARSCSYNCMAVHGWLMRSTSGPSSRSGWWASWSGRPGSAGSAAGGSVPAPWR